MNTILRLTIYTLLLSLISFGGISKVNAQGLEDFTNLPTNNPSSYQSRTWTGTDNVTWTAEGARTDQNINGKAITFGNNGTRQVKSPIYSGGMGVLTFNYVRAFTGTNARSLELYVNGVQIGSTITVSPNSDVVEQYNEIINLAGNVELEIRSTGAAQVKIDDISWTAYSSVNPFLTALPNALIDFDYLENNGPSASQSFELTGANLDGSDVSVALDGASNFELSDDDTNFFDSLNFPAFDGTATTIYVRLKAGLNINTYTDDITITGGGADPISVSLSGEVQPEPVLGWQITATNTDFVIDFDTTISGVNEGQYAGTGFEPAPTTGRLNSNAFATIGMSDGSTNFGDSAVTGDFARGTSAGGVTQGGFYAFEVAPGNHAFGWQATGNDFAPGNVTLRLQNQTGTAIETLRLTYTVYVYNDQGRSSNVNISYSNDNITFTQQPLLEIVSEETAAATPEWIATTYTVLIGLENIPDGDFYYLRWDTADVAGSGSRDEFAIDDITLMANPDNLVYSQGGNLLFPIYHLNGTLQPGDDLLVLSDTINFNFGDMDFGNITVNPGAGVHFENNLKIGGDLVNNGSFVFVSNASTTAQLDEVPASTSLLGEVEVQRYIPARRAFRLLSSAVTTTTPIRDHWQEGTNNPNTSTNNNPNPGYGTHITGSVSGANGFDATPSGNPSLFTLNNATQSWVAATDTDVTTIQAGKGYRLMVRGDRSIDVTSNSAPPTNTTLRSTGSLYTGTYTATDFNENAGATNFFGNPYPAAVDMNEVLATATNVNTSFYYIWDPTMGTRGAYIAVDLPAGTNAGGSDANQYLQSGQAAFVSTLANGPVAFSIQESHKAVDQPQTQVFDVSSKMDIRLYTPSAFAQGEKASDAVRIKFDTNASNAVTPQDAPKFFNLDENLATNNSGNLLSIESRTFPIEGESIPLFNNQYRTNDYVFEIQLSEINTASAILKDQFTGTETELTNNESTLYAFQVDENQPASLASDRFEIVFEELLHTNEVSFGKGFVLFPNPVQDEITLVTNGISGDEVQVQISNVSGQVVIEKSDNITTNGQLILNTSKWVQGVYVLKLTHSKGVFTTKFIKQ